MSKAPASTSIYNNPRVLIVSGPIDKVDEQLLIFDDAKEAMIERDMLVLRKTEKKQSDLIVTKLSHPEFLNSDLGGYRQYLSRCKVDVFNLMLIGKDGGLKEKWNQPISFDDVANIIDQMPMRVRETQGE